MMKLSVYNLKEILFEGEADKIITRTPLGEITVLEDHLPLVSTLSGPYVKVVKNDKEKFLEINSGILEVRPESEVVILAD